MAAAQLGLRAMGTIHEIRTALDAVEQAETQLDELAALARLDRLVREATSTSVVAALTTYTPTEVARALGVSRQAIAKRRPTLLAA
jgi:hypothetical protein